MKILWDIEYFDYDGFHNVVYGTRTVFQTEKEDEAMKKAKSIAKKENLKFVKTAWGAALDNEIGVTKYQVISHNYEEES